MKHTQGPWRISKLTSDKDYMVYTDSKPDFPIAHWYVDSKNEDESIANAHLIAAAPEMLEALQVLLSDWVAVTASGRSMNQRDIFIKALDVIKKAKGK